jgi:hypothetical protein
MSTTEQPMPRPIIATRLAELLQWAMSLRPGASTIAREAAAEPAAENADERDRGELPWWIAHHPAVSFRTSRREENRD